MIEHLGDRRPGDAHPAHVGGGILDTDTLSEIIKGRNLATQRKAQEYLGLQQRESAIADIEARLRTAAAPQLPARAEVPAVEAGCTPSSTTLCLNNNRFQVQATFDAGDAGSGTAQVGSLTAVRMPSR